MKSGQRLVHFDRHLLNVLDAGRAWTSIKCFKKSPKRLGVGLRQHFYTPIREVARVSAYLPSLCFSLGKPAESNALNATRDEQHVSLHASTRSRYSIVFLGTYGSLSPQYARAGIPTAR